MSEPTEAWLSEQAARDALIEAGLRAAARGQIPATSGNFSVRVDTQHIAITRSGCDKGRLTPSDIAVIDLREPLIPGLSAEAPLHVARYQADAGIAAIWHVHHPLAALLGRRYLAQGALHLTGWELQKAFAGIDTHLLTLDVPIFANSQDMGELVPQVERVLAAYKSKTLGAATVTAPAYLLAGHGAYVWGRSVAETQRHLDALDALLSLHHAWEVEQ